MRSRFLSKIRNAAKYGYCQKSSLTDCKKIDGLTLRRPLCKKLWLRWFFDVSKVKESSFFKIGPHWPPPPQVFDAHLLVNTDLSPSRFPFSVYFISRSCFESDGFIAYSNEWDWRQKKTIFIHTNQFLITSFYIKKGTYFLPNLRWVSADAQFSAQRAREGVNRSGEWGNKPIGHVRVNLGNVEKPGLGVFGMIEIYGIIQVIILIMWINRLFPIVYED